MELGGLRRLDRPGRVELGRVLVDQMRVLGASGAAEVLHLHHLRQDALVEVVLQRRLRHVPLEYVLILVLVSGGDCGGNFRLENLAGKKADRLRFG